MNKKIGGMVTLVFIVIVMIAFTVPASRPFLILFIPAFGSALGAIGGHMIGRWWIGRNKHEWQVIWEESRKDVAKDVKGMYLTIYYKQPSRNYSGSSVIEEVQDDTKYIGSGDGSKVLHKDNITFDNKSKTFRVTYPNRFWKYDFRLPFDCIQGISVNSKPKYGDLGELDGNEIYEVTIISGFSDVLLAKNVEEARNKFMDRFSRGNLATNVVTRAYKDHLKKKEEWKEERDK